MSVSKKYYFLVENPKGLKRNIFAETKFQAIAMASGEDNARYVFKEYKCKRLK